MNWPGLLAWSTKYHDGTAPSQFKVMSDEDRKFLEAAMEEAFGHVEDPNKVMQEALNQIRSPERTDEGITTALEVIDRCCDDVDCARNVELFDGLQPLLNLLETHEGPIRMRALEILALLFSNNPHIQEAGVKHGAMKIFLRLTREIPTGSEERAKAFRALVALVREVQVFEETLLEGADGMSVILSFLQPEEAAQSREKAASFARSLAGAGRLRAGDAEPLMQAITPLMAAVAGESLQYREMLADCALKLLLAFPGRCPPPLRGLLQERLSQIQAASDPEQEPELVTLQQCLAALDAGGAAASAA